MLSGSAPFYGEDNMIMFEKIKRCEWAFESKIWTHVSDLAKDLISKILVADPISRITIEQIFRHPWMTCEINSVNPLNE